MHARVVIFGLFVFLALAGFECSKPTEPPGAHDRAYAYFWDRNSGSRVFEYDLNELKFTREFVLPRTFKAGRYSSGRKKLFMFFGATGSDSISVFDIPSLMEDTAFALPPLTREASAELSADGLRLVFVAESPIDFSPRLHMMDLRDYSVATVDTSAVSRFGISKNGKYLFTYSPVSPIVTYRFSEENSAYEPIVEFDHSFSGVTEITGTNDGARIFLNYLSRPGLFNFAEIDASTGAPLYDSAFAGGFGRVALTSDDSYAFLTNPSSVFLYTGDSKIRIYDIRSHSMIHEVKTDSLLDAYPRGIEFSQLFVSRSDSLIIGGIPAFGIGDYGLIVSIPEWQVRDIFQAPDSTVILWLLGVD